MTFTIFISYADRDQRARQSMRLFKDHLLLSAQRAGLREIRVADDDGLVRGTPLEASIKTKIASSNAGVILLSKSYDESSFAKPIEYKQLLALALDGKLLLFPVRLARSETEDEITRLESDPFPSIPKLSAPGLDEVPERERTRQYELAARSVIDSIAKSRILSGCAGTLPKNELQWHGLGHRLGAEYAAKPEALECLVEHYAKLADQALHQYAKVLVVGFQETATVLGRDDRELLEFLSNRAGKVPHLPERFTPQTLRTFGYPAMLRAASLAESDGYPKAISALRAACRNWPILEKDPYFWYIYGLCARKIERYEEALARYERGIRLLTEESPPARHVELWRGKGAVSRVLGAKSAWSKKKKEAQKFFGKAEQAFKKVNARLLSDADPKARGDLLYSWGYLLFQMAWVTRYKLDGTKAEYLKGLRNAEKSFNRSLDDDPSPKQPAWARLVLVRTLMAREEAEPTDLFQGWLQAFHGVEFADDSESWLTRVLCHFGGVVVSQNWAEAEEVFAGLLTVLQTKVYTRAPLYCHWFDAYVIFHGSRVIHPDLKRTLDLLDEAVRHWPCNAPDWSLEKQQARVEEFLTRIAQRRRPLTSPRGGARLGGSPARRGPQSRGRSSAARR